MNANHPSAAVILAAGNSSRMRTHKALLKFDEGHNFIQKIAAEYLKANVQDIIVVVNSDNHDAIHDSLSTPEFSTVQLVLNQHPEWERFYSVQCGLSRAVAHQNCFIHNCDNPMVSADIINTLLQEFLVNHVVIPEYKGEKGHPVLLCRSIVEEVLRYNGKEGNLKVILDGFAQKVVEVEDGGVLVNINGVGDYLRIISR